MECLEDDAEETLREIGDKSLHADSDTSQVGAKARIFQTLPSLEELGVLNVSNFPQREKVSIFLGYGTLFGVILLWRAPDLTIGYMLLNLRCNAR